MDRRKFIFLISSLVLGHVRLLDSYTEPKFDFKPKPNDLAFSSLISLLNELRNPFPDIEEKYSKGVDEWVRALPVASSVNELAFHLKVMIRDDYLNNRVEFLSGVLLSQTESFIYQAKKNYA